MKTLVTGATGFIGSHLVKALIKEGREVRCLVRKTSRTNQLKELGVELFLGDLQDKQSLQQAVRGINVIYHLASEVYSMKSDKTYSMVNIQGTKNLLDASQNLPIKKFIFISSIAVMGPNTNKEMLLKETDICHPIVPYAKSKLEAEKLVLSSYQLHKFPVVVIRQPIVYGPEQKSELTKIFSMIKKGALKIIGDGNNRKSLCYIDNLIEGVLLAEKKSGNEGEIYFISDEKPYSINEICATVADLEGISASYIHIPAFISTISGWLFNIINRLSKFSFLPLFTLRTMTLNFACDISKAKRDLGYTPRVDLREGIKRTLEWYNHRIEN